MHIVINCQSRAHFKTSRYSNSSDAASYKQEPIRIPIAHNSAHRNPPELRSDPQQIASEVLVPTMMGAMIPLGHLAKIEIAKGAPVIRTENALLSACRPSCGSAAPAPR
ncbi:MAG: hypothetical protein AUK51_14170 [Comamonadaceae bacterium CG2_30_59_20]|nr:MAG: hypothetical protein AUK51_14170 [Comamonadaceae bacterium CG2_30_59_20]